jgi:adenosine deaminase
MTDPAGSHRDLATLPKAHLHLHLEGSMRPATLAGWAASAGVAVPPVGARTGFPEFLRLYSAAAGLVTTPERLRRLVAEVVDDAAADGAVWVEPHLYPTRLAAQLDPPWDTERAVLELVLDEAASAGARCGVGVGIMVAALRHDTPDDALRLARLAARYAGAGVVAFGLAADESLHPPEPFARAFAVARAAGLISAPHAGELAGPASVRGALDALGATRICHGVRALEDPGLVARLADQRVVLDVCPTSNALLGVVDPAAGPALPRLLAAGVRCTLNADDPLLFGPGVLGEYQLARDGLGLTDQRLAGIAGTSLEASGAPSALVTDSLAGVRSWLSAPGSG